MLERRLRRNMAPRSPDDQGELALEVELHGGDRPDEFGAVAHEALAHAHEQARELGQRKPGLGDVAPVVAPDADNLSGTANGG